MSDLTSRSESYMNDLIRRGDVLALFPINDCSDKMVGLYERVLDVPTAYDVDKVVAELENKSLKCKMESAKVFCEEDYRNNTLMQYVKQSEDMKAFAYDKAIETVKAGGIDG